MNKDMNQQNTTNSVITSNINAAGMQGTTNGAGMEFNNTTGMQMTNNVASQQVNSGMQGASNKSNSQIKKTVIGVFNSRPAAEKAVNDLRQRGFTSEEINIVSKEGRDHSDGVYDDDVTDGALTGGTLGGIGGLILGAGALAIPGVGPILAAGPIAAALSGAVAGGIAGGLIDWGIPSEASHRYEQSVARGGILAAVQTTDAKVNTAAQILRQHGASDVETHSKKS
jgi:hypothetical protein